MFRFLNIFLLLLLVLRHAQFYLNWGVVTEFGLRQHWLGILLIPVTGIFGASFHWKRDVIKLDKWNRNKMVIIGLIPFVLSYAEPMSVLTYDIFTESSRPPFLILLPIALSVFLDSKFLRLVVIVLYLFTANFICHYVLLFLGVKYLSNRGKSKHLLFFSPLLIFVGLMLSSTRISLLVEILWVYFVLIVLEELYSHIGPLKLPKLSVLYFYFAQAFVFRILALTELGDGLIVMVVFILSSLISILLNIIEKRAKNTFRFSLD